MSADQLKTESAFLSTKRLCCPERPVIHSAGRSSFIYPSRSGRWPRTELLYGCLTMTQGTRSAALPCQSTRTQVAARSQRNPERAAATMLREVTGKRRLDACCERRAAHPAMSSVAGLYLNPNRDTRRQRHATRQRVRTLAGLPKEALVAFGGCVPLCEARPVRHDWRTVPSVYESIPPAPNAEINCLVRFQAEAGVRRVVRSSLSVRARLILPRQSGTAPGASDGADNRRNFLEHSETETRLAEIRSRQWLNRSGCNGNATQATGAQYAKPASRESRHFEQLMEIAQCPR